MNISALRHKRAELSTIVPRLSAGFFSSDRCSRVLMLLVVEPQDSQQIEQAVVPNTSRQQNCFISIQPDLLLRRPISDVIIGKTNFLDCTPIEIPPPAN